MVVTIARQYGSCGKVIGEALAKRLNVDFYDKELLNLAAKESGISPEFFEKFDEKGTNSLLYSLSLGASATISSEYGTAPEVPMNDRLFLLQHDIIRRVSEKPCVIVGRCADYVLADRQDCVRVFICSDPEKRVERICRLHHLSQDKARAAIKKADKNRANYYNSYATGKWGDPNIYDLCINSGTLGIEKSAALIEQYLKLRGLI